MHAGDRVTINNISYDAVNIVTHLQTGEKFVLCKTPDEDKIFACPTTVWDLQREKESKIVLPLISANITKYSSPKRQNQTLYVIIPRTK